MLLHIPYGKDGLEYDFPEKTGVITSNVDKLKSERNGIDIVREAMASPIDSPKLSELAAGKKNAVIIISDHTRPVPSRDIIPLMLAELREKNPAIDVTLLVATGCHRVTTRDELVNKLGEDIVNNEKIVIHDGLDEKSLVKLGELSSGKEIFVNKLAAETELLVSEGFIEPHFFAGYSGGRKSVLPGVSAVKTVMANHCSENIDSELARTGNLNNNPIHEEMKQAAALAKLQYIVNVIIDEDKKTVAAFAGNSVTAHEAGCKFIDDYCRVQPRYADIVVTSNGGYPLDQNIYQCVKGMTAAEASANDGAVIILCARCNDGTGGEGFYRDVSGAADAKSLYASIMERPYYKTLADQWQTQILARILMRYTVIMVADETMRTTIGEMKMTYASTLAEAMDMAYELKGKDASVTVIPNGVSVVVKN